MEKKGNQTEKGKAFEYACVKVLVDKYNTDVEVSLVDSPQLITAKRFFSYMSELEKSNYIKGAKAAIKIIDRLEPKLANGDKMLVFRLQADSKGIEGDVRDVLCSRGMEWEIGLSCKHNHDAVKHSRLSDTIDFGKEWFDLACSQEYFDEVRSVFVPLRKIRDESKDNPVLWGDLPDKDKIYYVPVLNAFMKELKRLDKDNPGEIPARLIRYLIGTNDFYKVIMNDRSRYTRIDSININGSLNKPAGKKKALIDVPVVRLPSKFYEIGFKDGSTNTIYVVCDQGWNVSMRIHNASSKVEPSLKFDVKLIAQPSSILSQIEPWDE